MAFSPAPSNPKILAGNVISGGRSSGTGTTASIAAAAGGSGRRIIINMSGKKIEIWGSAITYGQGWPLEAGQYFSFDDSGRYVGAIYAVAIDGGTWTTHTMEY